MTKPKVKSKNNAINRVKENGITKAKNNKKIAKTEVFGNGKPSTNTKSNSSEMDEVKLENINEENNLYDSDHEETDNVEKDAIIPSEYFIQLLSQIENQLPYNDTLKYSSRENKLDWNKIAFLDYNADKCRNTWNFIKKQQRCFKILSELIRDSKEWAKTPFLSSNRTSKKKITHPDYPKKPLSAYMLYYKECRDKIISNSSGIKPKNMNLLVSEEYNKLPNEIKTKYCELALAKRAAFEQELEEFHENHPEVPRENNIDEQCELKPPSSPPTAFLIYYQMELKQNPDVRNRIIFKEECKNKWKLIPDKKKIFWIESAVRLENKYMEEQREYLKNYPEYEMKYKSVLTKEEILLKNKIDGKPEKPPASTYIFYKTEISKQEMYKNYDSKQYFLSYKGLSKNERKEYKEKLLALQNQYDEDYKIYLESLSHEKRAAELQYERQAKLKKFLSMKSKEKNEIDDKKCQLNYFALPNSWDDMSEQEKIMYMKYIQKVKNYFDSHHNKGPNCSDSESSD